MFYSGIYIYIWQRSGEWEILEVTSGKDKWAEEMGKLVVTVKWRRLHHDILHGGCIIENRKGGRGLAWTNDHSVRAPRTEDDDSCVHFRPKRMYKLVYPL